MITKGIVSKGTILISLINHVGEIKALLNQVILGAIINILNEIRM